MEGYKIYKRQIIISIALICTVAFNSFSQEKTDTSSSKIILPDTVDYFTGEAEFNLCKAAYDGNSKAVLSLLNKGASMEYYTDGHNALHLAILNNHADVVKILVLNGADVNGPAYEGETPLIMAVRNDNDEITDILCQNGALADSCDDYKRSPLMFAVVNGSLLLTDMLIFYGSNPELKDFAGNDAFMLATYTDQPEMASYLYRKGADINTRDLYNNTPLIVAAEKSYTDMIDSLLKWGANPDLVNNAGYTALAKAVSSDSLQIVTALAQNNQSLNQKIRPGINALDLAKGRPFVESILRQAGAHRSIWPDYHEMLIGFDFSSNFHDYMNNIHLGLFDPKFYTSLSLGFHARMTSMKIFVPSSDLVWYQYRERRYFIYAGFDKQFNVIKSGKGDRYGISLGIKGGYTFGNYRGSSANAAAQWLAVPSAQLFYSGRYTTFSIGYEYAKYPCFELNPGHLTASIKFHFPVRSEDVNFKNIYWIQTRQ